MKPQRAFTLIELLVVMAILAILAALLLPAISNPHHGDRVPSAGCTYNVKQLNLAIQMYLEDQNNGSPGNANAARTPFLSWTDYRELIKPYVNIKGPSSPQDRVFACPTDKFFYDMSGGGSGYVAEPMHNQTNHAFTSYSYNAGQFTTSAITNIADHSVTPATTNFYGIAGRRLETVAHPSATVLIAETAAYAPYSWHTSRRPFSMENSKFNDSKNVLGFVDGHAEFTKMYYDGNKIAWSYNPPAGYHYQWSAD